MTNLHERTARLREAVVPGRLAEAMPDWLTQAVRPKPAPVPWGAMIRAVLAVCVPLSAGIVTGRREPWLVLAIGGLTGTVIDTAGPYVVRVKRAVTAGVFGGAAGLVIGMLIHHRGWVAVASLVVVAGVSALISRLGSTASVTGLQLLVFSALGLGPFGALRPWWHIVLGYAVGVAWAQLLNVPGWLLSPRSAEQGAVTDVYHALVDDLRAIGTDRTAETRRAVTAALNTAYDTLLTARATAGGRSRRMTHLMAVLNASSRVSGAVITLRREGTRPPPLVADTLDRLADANAEGGPEPLHGVPPIPPPWSSSPGSLELRDALAALARTIAWPPEPAPRTPLRERARAVLDQLRGGRLAWTFTIRLMVCIGVAAVASEVLPLQRSYWVVLTVAIVVKPDNGSVFARALQRGIGTIVGAVLGAVILAAVPYGAWLLFPMAVLAAGQPYGRLRNFGLGGHVHDPADRAADRPAGAHQLAAPRRTAGRHAARLRDRAARRVRVVAEQLAFAPATAVRRYAARHLPVHGGGAHPGSGSGGPRPRIAAAPQGLPRCWRPARGVPAGHVRASGREPPRVGLVARDRRARRGGRRGDRHRGSDPPRRARPVTRRGTSPDRGALRRGRRDRRRRPAPSRRAARRRGTQAGHRRRAAPAVRTRAGAAAGPARSGNPVRSDVKIFFSERTKLRASGLVRYQSDQSYPG
jgi:Fusaric acid resistance protein-like